MTVLWSQLYSHLQTLYKYFGFLLKFITWRGELRHVKVSQIWF